MEALQSNIASDGSSLLDTLISALVEPVPFGADGENERDVEFQENVIRLVATLPLSGWLLVANVYVSRLLHTYSVLCGGRFSDVQRHSLRIIFDDVLPADNLFDLSREEFDAVKTAAL